MQISKLKVLMLILVSGIGGILLFIAGIAGFIYYKTSGNGSVARIELPMEKTVAVPPPIIETERFLGSHGVHSGDFASDHNNILIGGPGKLVGHVTINGKPLNGLRLRLALNGSVYSQWGTSDADGKYEISVPYAQYRIDGYGLDSSSADAVLKGKINRPQSSHASEVMKVAEGRTGRALDLEFVDPVKLLGPMGDVSLAKPVVIAWEPYPDATAYKIQIVEQQDPRNYATYRRLFDWNSQPTVSDSTLNLSEQGVTLKKGYHYTVEVHALDNDGRALSATPQHHGQPDFLTID
jgi:hypothetical protein